MISSDWIYCLAGVAGSFLISLFFFWLGSCEKVLYVDLVADRRYGELHNCVCMLKSIGRRTITMDDFAPKDRPHFMTEGLQSHRLLPYGRANINRAGAKRKGNDVYVTFDYLRRGEYVILILKNAKGIPGYRATQIDGKVVCFPKTNRTLRILAGILSIPLISGIAGLLFGMNVSIPWIFGVYGFLFGFYLIANLVKIRSQRNRRALEAILKHVNEF